MDASLAAVTNSLVELRRSLHRIPELAFREEHTAERVLRALGELGIPATYGGVGTGVVARLAGRVAGAPVVALRAEMDALPGNEATGLAFASEHPGRVHACGHDAHMTMVLGAAQRLRDAPPDGDVVFLFQPAEEQGRGARTMVRAGAVAGVDAIFAGHVTHQYRTGEIMVTPGPVTARSDRFAIKVRGRAGHGARPHEAVDAVIIVGLLISALQTLVSREINPMHPTVVTIGRVAAGIAANVIAEEGSLEGTIRTTIASNRSRVLDGIRRMAKAAGALHNATVDVELVEGNPPVINTPREAQICGRAAAAIVGADAVVVQDHPSMGSEDFAFYLGEVPGCYVRFGARPEGSAHVPLHSPAFTIDERVLPIGAAYFEAVAREAQRVLPRKP